MPSLDSGDGIFKDCGTLDWYAELVGGGNEGVRRRLTPEAFLRGDVTVNDDAESWAQVGGLEHRSRITRRCHDRDLGSALCKMIKELYRPRVGSHALFSQQCDEELILAIGESADRLGVGTVAGITLGELNASRREERADAVVAWLAVDVVEIVAFDVGLVDAPLAEEVDKELLPRPHMHLCGRGQHAVQIEQGGVVLMPVHTMKIRGCQASPRHNAEERSPTAERSRSQRDQSVRSGRGHPL